MPAVTSLLGEVVGISDGNSTLAGISDGTMMSVTGEAVEYSVAVAMIISLRSMGGEERRGRVVVVAVMVVAVMVVVAAVAVMAVVWVMVVVGRGMVVVGVGESDSAKKMCTSTLC